MATEAKVSRARQGFTSVDGFLAEEGMLKKFEALAKSDVLDWRAKGGAKGGKSVGSAATRAAITELEAGKGRRIGSVDALMADMRAED
jgi:hypothetical protein